VVVVKEVPGTSWPGKDGSVTRVSPLGDLALVYKPPLIALAGDDWGGTLIVRPIGKPASHYTRAPKGGVIGWIVSHE
jgi:hypothetical protein